MTSSLTVWIIAVFVFFPVNVDDRLYNLKSACSIEWKACNKALEYYILEGPWIWYQLAVDMVRGLDIQVDSMVDVNFASTCG